MRSEGGIIDSGKKERRETLDLAPFVINMNTSLIKGCIALRKKKKKKPTSSTTNTDNKSLKKKTRQNENHAMKKLILFTATSTTTTTTAKKRSKQKQNFFSPLIRRKSAARQSSLSNFIKVNLLPSRTFDDDKMYCLFCLIFYRMHTAKDTHRERGTHSSPFDYCYYLGVAARVLYYILGWLDRRAPGASTRSVEQPSLASQTLNSRPHSCISIIITLNQRKGNLFQDLGDFYI